MEGIVSNSNGQLGGNGKSAYEIAIDNGFVGTEVQWLASLVGAQGIPGNNGADGAQGIQGIPGNNGADGQQGLQGVPGANGAQGLPGNDGVQGIQGIPGNDGAQGIQGVPGNDGATGAQGIQGLPGATGAQGIQGIPGVTIGYTLSVQALTSSPADGATIYFGQLPKAPVTVAATSKIHIRKAGVIKSANIYCYSGTAGTAESWSMSIRLNNTTDTLIQAVALATSERIFSNTSLNIAVGVGDYIEIKCVNPTWVTNPLTCIFGGYVYIE